MSIFWHAHVCLWSSIVVTVVFLMLSLLHHLLRIFSYSEKRTQWPATCDKLPSTSDHGIFFCLTWSITWTDFFQIYFEDIIKFWHAKLHSWVKFWFSCFLCEFQKCVHVRICVTMLRMVTEISFKVAQNLILFPKMWWFALLKSSFMIMQITGKK